MTEVNNFFERLDVSGLGELGYVVMDLCAAFLNFCAARVQRTDGEMNYGDDGGFGCYCDDWRSVRGVGGGVGGVFVWLDCDW